MTPKVEYKVVRQTIPKSVAEGAERLVKLLNAPENGGAGWELDRVFDDPPREESYILKRRIED